VAILSGLSGLGLCTRLSRDSINLKKRKGFFIKKRVDGLGKLFIIVTIPNNPYLTERSPFESRKKLQDDPST